MDSLLYNSDVKRAGNYHQLPSHYPTTQNKDYDYQSERDLVTGYRLFIPH
ncbi:hypothetical protein BDB01DRAFT_817312 [Pilobolus umbonatus]|nr:hypothetical protein BDB01DRAFT_817312 [Pilobolus umbonatus]